jgi:ABC-type molybdate transport system substrate-binding protein
MAKSGDVTVFCDLFLKPAILTLSGLAGFGIYPLCAPGPAMVAQLIRHTRNDVLFSLAPTIDAAMAAGLVVPSSRIGGLTNQLVLAGSQRAGAAGLDQAGLQALLAKSRVAVTDDTPAANLDGRAILAANNLTAAQIQGVATTADAAFMVTSGAADLGLIYLTDALADSHLTVFATLNAPPSVTRCAAAVNAHAFSPNAQALVDLIRSPAGIACLGQAGVRVSA